MKTDTMTVYPCGYNAHASQIATLMRDHHTLFIDLRKNPDSRMPTWKRAALIEQYGDRYGWLGSTLGNANYKTGGPIQLIKPRRGIACLRDLLCQGYRLLLVCGCRDYERCHRRTVVELLRQAIPELQVIQPDNITQPGTVKALCIKQPWPWLITHPEIVKAAGLPPKDLENRDWTSAFRGSLYIHAGVSVDEDLFDHAGHLLPWYWRQKFGEAGEALYAQMPQHKNDYPRRAIVGQSQLISVVTTSTSPWFNGIYGFVLSQATAISPISYPGSLKIFDIPASVLKL